MESSEGLCISRRVFVVQLLSCVQLFATPWTTAHQVPLSFTISQSLLKLMSIELALCIRWLKYWSFSFSVSPSNEYSGLISFRMDWFDLLAVQRTLPRVFSSTTVQKHLLQCSAFFLVQLSHRYMTTRKTIALTRQTFVGTFNLSVSSCLLLLLVLRRGWDHWVSA